MKNVHSSAERLFDSIGGIDDRYIAEAQAYRPCVGKRARGRRIFVIAAAALLSLALIIGTLPLAISIILSGNSSAPATTENPVYLSDLLARHARSMTPLDSAPDLSDGTARLIWSCDGELYAVNIGKKQLSRLAASLAADTGGSPSQNTTHVWLSLGDGRVLTPELRLSAGNISYGTLFDYNAEISPSRDVVDSIRRILET